jgi:beta-lactam-binding protein with PASTA domain
MAPEQALGGPLGPRTDLYATGVIAYELLTGRVPFGPPDPPIAILCKHVNEQVPPLRRPDLHPDLLAWLERMLAKEPRRRPAGAREAWEQLEDVVLAVYGARWRRRARLTPPASARPSLRVATPVPESPATPVPESPPPELPAPEPPSEPRRAERRHGWRIGLAGATGLAAVLAAAFVVVAHRAPAPVPVRLPALTGMSEADAVDAIQALGLRIDARHVRRTASIETARGLVFEQRPLPGARLRDGTFVTLVVSAGKPRVRVPDVRGRKLKAAGRALRRAHLRTTTIRLHSRRPIGTVLAQSTRPGRRARWGSKVTLRVSIGPPLVVVPQLYGLSSEAAAARLQAASLHVVRVDIDSSEPAGIVVGQATPGCRKLVRGRAVTVYVSRGPRVVVVHGNGVSGNGGSDRRTTRTHRKPKQIWEGG